MANCVGTKLINCRQTYISHIYIYFIYIYIKNIFFSIFMGHIELFEFVQMGWCHGAGSGVTMALWGPHPVSGTWTWPRGNERGDKLWLESGEMLQWSSMINDKKALMTWEAEWSPMSSRLMPFFGGMFSWKITIPPLGSNWCGDWGRMGGWSPIGCGKMWLQRTSITLRLLHRRTRRQSPKRSHDSWKCRVKAWTVRLYKLFRNVQE